MQQIDNDMRGVFLLSEELINKFLIPFYSIVTIHNSSPLDLLFVTSVIMNIFVCFLHLWFVWFNPKDFRM